MEFVIEAGGDAYEVRVRGAHDRLSLGDVLSEAGRVESVAVDGVAVSPEALFSRVVRTGSLVSPNTDGRDHTAPDEAAPPDRRTGGRTPFNRPPRSEFPLVLPPLRERDGDVQLLSRHFACRFARYLGRPVAPIDDAVLETFRKYPWPGNVRELENVLQRMVIMDADGRIGPDDVPAHLTSPHEAAGELPPWGPTLADAERQVILGTLRDVSGNRTRAAERLDISTRTIRNKLKKYMAEGHIEEDFS